MPVDVMAPFNTVKLEAERTQQSFELAEAELTLACRLLKEFADPSHAGSNRSRAIRSRHANGASVWTLAPLASTATVTGKSATSNS